MIVKIQPTNGGVLTLHNSTFQLAEAFGVVTLTKHPDGRVTFAPAYYLTLSDAQAAIASKVKPRAQVLNTPTTPAKMQGGQMVNAHFIEVTPSDDTTDAILNAVNEWLADKNFVISHVN
jgi:hypothetical protein